MMISPSDDRYTRHGGQRRVDVHRESYTPNEKKTINDIVNRRHSIAHINFRKAVYRSLSLPQANDDESNNPISIQYFKYFMKFFFICLFILLIGFLIRLMWFSSSYK